MISKACEIFQEVYSACKEHGDGPIVSTAVASLTAVALGMLALISVYKPKD
jgi:hypothetical protein